jgi:two-component system, NarL family, sensor histidine kinase UhpB
MTMHAVNGRVTPTEKARSRPRAAGGGATGLRNASRTRRPRPDYASLAVIAIALIFALVMGAVAAAHLVAGSFGSAALLGAAALSALLLLPLHFAALRTMSIPLRSLEKMLERLGPGELAARGDPGGVPRPHFREDTAGVVDRLLERIASDRRRLRETAARGARAQEVERIRMARDLRDDLAQTLSGVLIQLRVARAVGDPVERERLLEAVGSEVAGTIDRLRRFAQAVHPPALEELGLVAAVKSYARTVSASTQLRIDVHGPDLRGVLTPDSALALYRITQEALANAARHARASHASVRIEVEGSGEVTTVIEDDGIGFDLVDTESRLPCLGLFTIRERALAVDGSLEIRTRPGGGTVIAVRLPTAVSADSDSATWPRILPSRV